jgi:LPXTG-site transpeptidase (sortase) family protein
MVPSRSGKLIIAIGVLLLLSGLSSTLRGLRTPVIDPVEANQPLSEDHQFTKDVHIPQISIANEFNQIRPELSNNHEVETLYNPEEDRLSLPTPVIEYQTRPLSSQEHVKINAEPEIPVRIAIPAIQLEAPVTPTETRIVTFMGGKFLQWQAPAGFAAGWHQDSARLGETGNLVLNGHNNLYGEVFRDLDHLEPGDKIYVYSEENLYQYEIANTMILPEKFQELNVRVSNAQWILQSEDQRLTLVTCWPYASNSHRLIIVAKPVILMPEDMK